MPKTPIDLMLDAVEWRSVEPPTSDDDELPYATHSGELRIGDMVLRCYQLNTGERIFNAEDIEQFFGG